jgi:hypothetical protein
MLMRNITDTLSWQIAEIHIFQTKGDKFEAVRKWHRYSPVVVLGLKVLKLQILISYSVQGLPNCRHTVIWLQLCLSVLANYQFVHLQTCVRKIPSVVLGYLSRIRSYKIQI